MILKPGYCYHITSRCNNREFRLTRFLCRQVFLYTLKKALDKFKFKLYALCIMSNHVHYLIESQRPQDLPKIMHYINWYTAMCFNRMLKRSGHFWEKRYHSSAFETTDKRRALNTLRYIHGNPKAAKMQPGFFYDFSNYGAYDRLSDDGLTTWHPAFLELGETLEACASKYRKFCQKYQPQGKKEKRFYWGSQLLPQLAHQRKKKKRKPLNKDSSDPHLWENWKANHPDILAVAEKFILANCYNPKSTAKFLRSCC